MRNLRLNYEAAEVVAFGRKHSATDKATLARMSENSRNCSYRQQEVGGVAITTVSAT
jgi:hypothetical protein